MKWLVAEGDHVKRREAIYKIETDDGQVLQVGSFQEGTVRRLAAESTSYLVGHVVGIVEFTELERLELFHYGVELNHDQRQVIESLRGDMDARVWLSREIMKFVSDRLSRGEEGESGQPPAS